MEEYFIDENVKILTGQNAKKALEAKNDEEFISKNKGIIKVPLPRWKEAQRAERVHWMIRGIGSLQDRNDFHAAGFEHYRVLHNIQFKNVIELGCGPFTNLRIIGTKCRIIQCALLDPLIKQYLSHPFCSYTEKYLYLEAKSLFGRLLHRLSPKIHRTLQNTLCHRIPVSKILANPIESMPTDELYDMVILINVLEHCYDVSVVFQKVLDIMAEGSMIIFHDTYYEHTKVVSVAKTTYDAAHPLKVDKSLIDEFLNNNFEAIYKNVQKHIEPVEWLGEILTWEEVYFIGMKKHK
jgi:SAM-dependent methyltransferase